MDYNLQELEEFTFQLIRLADYFHLKYLDEMRHSQEDNLLREVCDKEPQECEHQLEWDYSTDSPYYWN